MSGPKRASGGWHVIATLAVLACLSLSSCHVKQELNPSGPGSEVSQVIKFESLLTYELLIRIPDANQEFNLGANQSRTVEVYSEDGITTFYVEIFDARRDPSVAGRWTGFVTIGQRVTVQHIARVYVDD